MEWECEVISVKIILFYYFDFSCTGGSLWVRAEKVVFARKIAGDVLCEMYSRRRDF